MKRWILLLFIFPLVVSLFGQAPKWYYNMAVGKSGVELKKSLCKIVNPHTIISYDNVWLAYKYTDVNANGFIDDIYTDCSFIVGENQCGQTSASVCVCYNREHAFCQSWFKSSTIDNTKTPMYTDVHHLYPTDGKVNSTRNNNPYGETSSGTVVGTGKIGNCDFETSGYTGRVFEPSDEYKGDLARTYFYFLTCYADSVPTWKNCPILDENGQMREWSREMMLRWHTEDPVSQKEIDRNNAVYKIQLNRNPFVDYPELAEKVFGTDNSAFMSVKSQAIVTIYSENCGVVSSNTPVSANQWQNINKVKYSGTTDVRSTYAGSKYATASGGGNVWFASGGKYLQISDINTTGYSDAYLTFGLRCEQKDASADMFAVEYSTDGIVWKPLSMTMGFPLSSGWSQVVCEEVLPSVRKLHIRFTNKKASGYQFRVDDIIIRGLRTSQTPSTSMYFMGEKMDNEEIFQSSVTVNMYCTDEEAQIYYSLDETTPTQLYSEPILIEETTTISTFAHNPDLDPSPIEEDTITINLIGIDEINGNRIVNIYQRNGNIIISSDNSPLKSVLVHDILGNVIFSQHSSTEDINSITIPTQSCNRGIYIVRIATTEGFTATAKIAI